MLRPTIAAYLSSMSVLVGLNMCDQISCSAPLGLDVSSPFELCALARKGRPR